VDIVVEFHRRMTDWGGHVPENAGRLVRAKLTPKRLVLKLTEIIEHVFAASGAVKVIKGIIVSHRGVYMCRYTYACLLFN